MKRVPQMDFIPNMQVRTTEEYYAKHQRRVEGVIIEPKIDIGEDMVIVRWISQSGEVNRSLDGQMVLMHKKYVEPSI